MEPSYMHFVLPHLLNVSPSIVYFESCETASSLPQSPIPQTVPHSKKKKKLSSMGRPPCCDKANVKRGPWTPEEDAKILAYVASHGIGNWTLVPQKAGLNRCGKSCRLRWTNYLRPDLKHDNFTPEEEECILELHKTIGSRWSLIAKRLPGRTDNDVKNYWNTKLKKKLTKMGIDPVTHKPFSQLFCEYGKISGTGIRHPYLPNFTGNKPVWKPETHQLAEEFSLDQEYRTQKIEKSPFNLLSENDPMEPMAQFQFINRGNSRPSFYNEASSSDSLASSSGVMLFEKAPSGSFEPSQVQIAPSSPPFACSDYFLEDHFSFTDTDQVSECKHMEMLSFTDDSGSVQEEGVPCNFVGDQGGNNLDSGKHSKTRIPCSEDLAEVQEKCSPHASSTAAGSFVDDILAYDDEMQLQFPNILDEISDY